VRESLFNVLTARLDLTGAAVLDLYAGSGALGLEALSRGAASALFVESDGRAAAVITQNVSSLGVSGAVVRRGEVGAVLSAGAHGHVDLVLADPPYVVTQAEVSEVLAALVEHGWVSDGSVVVLERPASGPPQQWPAGWSPWRERRYGDTRLEMAEVGLPDG
jgi:16S rRNA (guanine(966)-N(2))-methyltransferase RsmD